MDKKLAMKWVKALRSGKYEQGIAGNLKDDKGGYCCLGVLCDLEGISTQGGTYGGHSLGTHFGTMFGGTSLANLNDGSHHLPGLEKQRFTFEEIADIIEQAWEEL